MRKVKFITNEFFHIYNRVVEKRPIFLDDEDYLKFERSLKDFNNKSYYEERAKMVEKYGFKELSSFLGKVEKIVGIAAYVFLDNHFHLILKQLVENGISLFMHKIGTSLTNYSNKKYNRSGVIFQGPFKAVHVDNNDYLLWLSAYVNGNPQIHGIADAQTYQWSSYRSFLGLGDDEIISEKEIILSQFRTREEYKNFTKVVIEESRKRKEMEKYLLEEI